MSEEEDFESKVINNTKAFFSQNSELSKNNDISTNNQDKKDK